MTRDELAIGPKVSYTFLLSRTHWLMARTIALSSLRTHSAAAVKRNQMTMSVKRVRMSDVGSGEAQDVDLERVPRQ